MEQRGPTEFWWPNGWHPTKADAVVMVHNLENIAPYTADLLILASNGLGAYLGPDDEFATGVDAVACFSECHADLLARVQSKVAREKCVVTGLGVDLYPYSEYIPGEGRAYLKAKVPGRIWVGNDPQRGLWHVLDIFEEVQKRVPEATLHISYDWERVFAQHRFDATATAERLWDCDRRIKANPAITSLGALSREEVVREQLECQVHLWPSDPPNVGSQIHGLTQMEAAAAGCALVLSDVEAFPEVFGDAAQILPIPGTFIPALERRYDAADWAEAVVQLMTDSKKWDQASQAARALAEHNTWDAVVGKWDALLAELAGKVGR